MSQKKNVLLISRNSHKEAKLLFGLTAGRCEFFGCNKNLLKHHITGDAGNFADMGHIYAFSKNGPRGKAKGRPKKDYEIDSLDNLILLCKEDHHEIDKVRPQDFSVAKLRSYKKIHEDRIQKQTDAGEQDSSHVLKMAATVSNQADVISEPSVREAIAPLWKCNDTANDIQLANIDCETASGLETARETIKNSIIDFQRKVKDDQAQSVSIFAIGPIYLLTFLGSQLSNQVKTHFYNKSRNHLKPWQWTKRGTGVKFKVENVQKGSNKGKVALVLSVSGKVNESGYTNVADDSFYIYEISSSNMTPGRELLKSVTDLESFRSVYRDVLEKLIREHPDVKSLHVFPAVPAAIAVTLGFDLLQKVHPKLVMYDYMRNRGGFIKKLVI